MKRILSSLFLSSLLLSACTIPVGSTAQPMEDTPVPYPDTPSPVTISAPLVESPALVSIHFINSLDGWGVTETQIVRTNDGGITWYNVTPPDLTETGYKVAMDVLDNDHVWVHLPDYDNYPNSGTLYRTTDGGLAWVTASSPFSGGDIHFLDVNNGWVLADLGVGAGSNAVAVYQTTDGGASWHQKYINDPNAANAGESLPLGGLKAGLAPLNMQTAWVYGVTYASGKPYLFRTDDGGANWSEVTLPLPPGAENFELGIDRDQMKFVSSNDGFIAMRFTGDIYQLAVYVTRDGGNTWTLTPTLIPDGGSVNFMSAEEAVIYNGNQFYVTRDAARTWSIIPPDVKFGDVFAGMDFSDPNTGWVITLDPNNHRSLYGSGDGGATWFPIIP
ncbi:MAG TPA: hypothetical protein VLT51_03790 [Anaerolineales bacterium]|nr:hypothetical protein [Anaerolineales bacterium]